MCFDYERWGKAVDMKFEEREAIIKKDRLLAVIDRRIKYRNILEIGCGKSLTLGKVARALGIKQVYGSDIAESMIEDSRRLLPEATFVKMDVTKKWPKYFPERFDLIILCDILEHVKDHEELLRIASERGKCVGFVVPLEKSLYLYLKKALYRKEIPGLNHSAGHIFAWGKNDVLRIIGKHFNVISYEVRLPKRATIRYSRSKSKNMLSRIYFKIEHFLYYKCPKIYLVIIGAHLYVFASSKK